MLFGEGEGEVEGDDDTAAAVLASRTNELTLTGTRQARDGGVRNTYRGFFSVTPGQDGKGKGLEKSLLD